MELQLVGSLKSEKTGAETILQVSMRVLPRKKMVPPIFWFGRLVFQEEKVYCFVGIPSLYASIILLILEGTDWEGGVYKVIVSFPDEYPSKVVTMRYTLFSTVEKNSLLFLYSHLIANLCRQFSIQTFLLQVIRLSFSQQKKLF